MSKNVTGLLIGICAICLSGCVDPAETVEEVRWPLAVVVFGPLEGSPETPGALPPDLIELGLPLTHPACPGVVFTPDVTLLRADLDPAVEVALVAKLEGMDRALANMQRFFGSNTLVQITSRSRRGLEGVRVLEQINPAGAGGSSDWVLNRSDVMVWSTSGRPSWVQSDTPVRTIGDSAGLKEALSESLCIDRESGGEVTSHLYAFDYHLTGQQRVAAGKLAENPDGADQVAGRYDCLTTARGVPRKVIVKRENAFAYRSESLTEPTEPLRFFRKYFVFEDHSRPGVGYLVGEATVKDSITGWVRAEDVLPWNHEQAVYFSRAENQQVSAEPVRIWMDRQDVGDASQTHFAENLGINYTSEPFPILEKDGSQVRVAFLWKKPEGLEAVRVAEHELDLLRGSGVDRDREGRGRVVDFRGGELGRIQRELERMDIVLVMDVTSSMRPYMEMVSDRLIDLVDALGDVRASDLALDANIGVVAYRDYADEPMVTALDLTSDRGEVRRFLRSLQPFSRGVGKNEAVFEGLASAIEEMKWGAHSYRVVILVGDAPPHLPDDTDTRLFRENGITPDTPFFGNGLTSNVARIQSMLREGNIKIHALGVGPDPEMQDTFASIVEGSTGGAFIPMANADEFIPRLHDDLKARRAAHAETGKRAARVLTDATIDPNYQPSHEDALVLIERDISVEMAESLRDSRMQTGWFDIDAAGNRVSVSVYLRRRDLEQMFMDLRAVLGSGAAENQLAVLKKTIAPHVGGEESLKGIRNVNEMIEFAKGLPLPPDIVQQVGKIVRGGSPDATSRQRLIEQGLRERLENIYVLMYQRDLFNSYEEGWIPMEYLPGSYGDREHR